MKKKGNIKNKNKTKLEINKRNKKVFYLFARYIILLLSMFSLPIIYYVLYKPTFYSVVLIMKLFSSDVVYNVILGTISIDNVILIQIIPACIAGSAYLLLLILNLSVDMNLKKRIYSVLLSFFLFFFLNISRIILLLILYKEDRDIFYFTHTISWYVISIIIVVLIWFFIVKIFSIKSIPFYSDLRKLIEN